MREGARRHEGGSERYPQAEFSTDLGSHRPPAPATGDLCRMDLIDDVNRRGGLAATYELLRMGWTSHQLTRAVRAGLIIRVRQGWYTVAETEDVLQQSVRVGGRLACVSAARAYGLWVPVTQKLHVVVEPHVSRLRSATDKTVRLSTLRSTGVVVHWRDECTPHNRFSSSVRECLRQMCVCQRPEVVISAVDSALRQGLISRTEWLAEISQLPGRLPRLLKPVDPRSESIIESFTRFRLWRRGLTPRVQVRIRGVGRVDLLIGTRLVIELDGWEFHSSREQFEEDRRRDAVLSALGYHVLRFSYRQIMYQWSEVLAAIEASIARGDHLS
jgi:very-short-patch-repair endonuclease